ncbi:hypothetical protein [Salinispora mooreana]|uniref:hypothetical protein n=1 Tax=Salinispora mooreana TaxID=999545 RepID=UPI00036B7EA4|nr:hypothetical protein [Salinispora mooreana]
MPEPKRRGRPKTTGTTPPLNIRVPQDVQDAAREAAKKRGERFAVVVTRLLAEYAREGQ